MEQDLRRYLDHIIAEYRMWARVTLREFEPDRRADEFARGLHIEEKSRYYKVIKGGLPGHRSVHSFIDKVTGEIWKAASWNARSNNFSRGNIKDLEYPRIGWEGVK